jgi:hypothetical protein
MIPVHSSWLSAHGKLWYDDKWYRLAWIVLPQALALLAMLWFWATPTASKNAQWAKPVDPAQRVSQLLAVRDAAKTSKVAMDSLERRRRDGRRIFLWNAVRPGFQAEHDRAAGCIQSL